MRTLFKLSAPPLPHLIKKGNFKLKFHKQKTA
ncbi:hypothetical protein [Listeria phage vB_Lmo_3274]